MEHCISTFKALQKENLFRVYVTELLRAFTHSQEVPRYYDLISSMDNPKAKEADPEEIKNRIKEGINNLRSKNGSV